MLHHFLQAHFDKAGGSEGGSRACQLTVIGETVEEEIWVEMDGERRRVVARGYERRRRKI